METGDAYLKIDKDWNMDELATLTKLYNQCYSLVYSLSGFELESDDERAIDWFKGVYAKYPWRGGYSTVNFYHSLYAKLPYDARPAILEIQYASPGHIKLKEALIAAGMLAGIVAAITNSIDDIHDTYNKIQHGMSQRKLTKLEVELKELELDKERLKFVKESKKELIHKMKIPQVMESELSRRSDGNELMELKILMSFHRRIEPLAIMQGTGMLKIEHPDQMDMHELKLHVFKDSFGPIVELLNKYNVKYQMQQIRSAQVAASSGVIELLLSPAMWGSLAIIIVAFIKAKNGREVIITTKDDKIIHAKGLTKEEIEPLLKEAKNLAAIDTNKEDGEQNKSNN